MLYTLMPDDRNCAETSGDSTGGSLPLERRRSTNPERICGPNKAASQTLSTHAPHARDKPPTPFPLASCRFQPERHEILPRPTSKKLPMRQPTLLSTPSAHSHHPAPVRPSDPQPAAPDAFAARCTFHPNGKLTRKEEREGPRHTVFDYRIRCGRATGPGCLRR
jgi:hypothetical protein